nr:hypothetical protein [Caballeronia sordidicola]
MQMPRSGTAGDEIGEENQRTCRSVRRVQSLKKRNAMSALSKKNLGSLPDSIAVPAYDRGLLSPGMAHIGVGNFHRTHQAVFVNRCLHLPGHEKWAIVGIGLGDSAAARAKAHALRCQDGLYSVTEYAADGSARTRVADFGDGDQSFRRT